MSKLTDIKRRIDELDGGAFQNLCDTYLCYKGYGNGYSLGMSTGTNKTAKGNPDTYFLTADNKYSIINGDRKEYLSMTQDEECAHRNGITEALIKNYSIQDYELLFQTALEVDKEL